MKKSMRRLLVIICVATMLVGVIPVANLGQVNATELTEEKTVFAGKITSGTVTPGNGNTEVCDEEGYVFGGYYNSYDADKEQGEQFSDPLAEAREATEDAPVYIRWVPEEVMNVKAQVREDKEDECKLVISDCDTNSVDSNLSTATGRKTGFTVDKDNKQEGGASLSFYRATSSGALSNFYLNDTVDVTGYKYFSCKIKIEGTLGVVESDGVDGLTADDDCLYIILNSPNINDVAEASTSDHVLKFKLTQNELNNYKMDGEDGWYDLKLPFAQAEEIAVVTNTPEDATDADKKKSIDDIYDGSNVSFIQFRSATTIGEGGVTLWVDDICALNENPGFLIGDCDQLKAPNCGSSYNTANSFTFINAYGGALTENKAANEVKEGTGAIKNICYSPGIMRTLILQSDANRLDISKYEENGGYIHFWLFISDIDSIEDEGKFTITISSNASASKNCRMWYVDKADLTDGWNEIVKHLNNPDDSSDGTTLDLTQVNYFRVNTENATEASVGTAYMILDDVRIIDTVQITDCDSQNEINTEKGSGHVLSTTEDVMQGNYAFVQTTSAKSTVHQLYFKEAIDFSGFKGNNGSLHFWFYIEDTYSWNPSETKGLLVRLNDGTYNQDYRIMKTDLRKGWNEVYINLDKPAVDQSEFSWTAIQYLLLSCEGKGTTVIKTMIDDISLVAGNKNTADVRFVSTVESLEYKSVGYEISQSFSPDKPLTADTRDVYETLYELGTDGELDSVTPSGISGLNCSKRMYTATIVNLPNRLWDAVFTVTPYWVTQDGTKVTGEARELTMNYLLSVTKQGKAQTDFRVLITSDVHCTTLLENKTGYYYGVSLEDRMNLWVDAILEEHDRQPIDLLIVNGDVSLDYWVSGGSVIAHNGVRETETFMKYVAQLREEMPVIVLPGNHEQYGEATWQELTGNSRSETYVLGNNLFIMPDSYGADLDPTTNSDGTYTPFDVDELKEQIAEYPDYNIYIISHYINMTLQDEAFLTLLQENDNIIGLFSGHTHTAYTLNGETYGGKVLAETGNFSYTKDTTTENNFWGFRDLVITEYHASSRYITAECDPIVNGEQVHYDRKEINEIWYY